MYTNAIKRSIKGAGFAAALALGLMVFAGTSNAQYYPNGGYYPNQGPGYGRYDRNEQKRIDKAYKNGFKDGEKRGKNDAKQGYRNGSYRNGNYGGGILGTIFGNGRNNRYGYGQEQRAYEDGYRRGYQEAYDREMRNHRGRYNNGRIWPF